MNSPNFKKSVEAWLSAAILRSAEDKRNAERAHEFFINDIELRETAADDAILARKVVRNDDALVAIRTAYRRHRPPVPLRKPPLGGHQLRSDLKPDSFVASVP